MVRNWVVDYSKSKGCYDHAHLEKGVVLGIFKTPIYGDSTPFTDLDEYWQGLIQ